MTKYVESYLEAQLMKVSPYPYGVGAKFPRGQVSIRITSVYGATNWLDITPDQLRVIEIALLTNDNTTGDSK